MFTGIVETVGHVTAVERRAAGRRLEIRPPDPGFLESVAVGDSISIAGVCQTVVTVSTDTFAVESIATTLSRTTLGDLVAGAAVNLERALALGQRLGGHLVQGHVDGIGTVVAVERADDHTLLDFDMLDDVADVTVLHGSITVDGVSLTVNALPAANVAQVALIPHTRAITTLGALRRGSPVNLEGDMIGRFVAHLLRRGRGSGVS
jgi:riboflavin synthase